MINTLTTVAPALSSNDLWKAVLPAVIAAVVASLNIIVTIVFNIVSIVRSNRQKTKEATFTAIATYYLPLQIELQQIKYEMDFSQKKQPTFNLYDCSSSNEDERKMKQTLVGMIKCYLELKSKMKLCVSDKIVDSKLLLIDKSMRQLLVHHIKGAQSPYNEDDIPKINFDVVEKIDVLLKKKKIVSRTTIQKDRKA